MSFFDTYSNILKQKGGSVNNSDIRNSENAIIRQFKNDKSYNGGLLKKSDFSEEEIDTRVVNSSNINLIDEKYIYLLPHVKIDVGSYFYYDNVEKYYLVMEYEYNLLSPYCKTKECNQIFKWKDKDGIHEFPCYCKNDSYGVQASKGSWVLTDLNTKLKIYLQFNKDTEKLEKNLRLIFNSRKTDIYKIIDIATVIDKNLLVITCENDEYRNQSDDLANNIADNSDLYNNNQTKDDNKDDSNEEDKPSSNPTKNYKIIGKDKIVHKNTYEYSLSPENNNCIWELDQDSVDLELAEITSQTSESCEIYANEVDTNETIILYAKDNNKILSKKEIIITRK